MTGYPDRRYFARSTADRGFRAGPLETVFRLTELRSRIDARFGDELSLRGGTVLNLLHLDVPRLSVDIDLDFVGIAEGPTLLGPTARRARADVLASTGDDRRSPQGRDNGVL